MADVADRGSLSERELPSTVGDATRDSQLVKLVTDDEATIGVGPDDSTRGSGVIVADVSNSTNIVVEVSRIAGLPGIGPAAVSAAAAAMIGSVESRRAIVSAVRLSGVRAADSVDSMRLGLRIVAMSLRAVFAASNVGGRLGCGPGLSTRGGVLAANELIVSGVALVAGSTTSSVSGTALGTAGDFAGSVAVRAFAVGELTDDPVTVETVRFGGNSERAVMSLDVVGFPIGAASVRSTLSDWVGNGNSVAAIGVTPGSASGSMRLLGAVARLVAPLRASEVNRETSASDERRAGGGVSWVTRAAGARSAA